MTQHPSVNTSLTLLGRVEAGDEESWSQMARLYQPLVAGWCRNAGLPRDDVDDIIQDVFQVLTEKLESFEPGRKPSGAFRSWLWGITRLKIVDRYRNAKRQPVGYGGTENHLNLHRLEQSTEPENIDGMTAQQVLLKNAVQMIQDDFDPRTWQAFWDMAVKGRTAKDIGADLDMTAKAVRQAKFRVTRKLRDLLNDDFANVFGTLKT